MSREAKERGEPSEYVSIKDNSVCARCGAYSGDSTDHPIIGKLPLCARCAPQVTNWPYPTWLKATLASLLILLVVALVHGRKYFHAGRTMYRGERLVDEGQFQAALPYLRETLQIAPESDKAVLLTAKAALKIGDLPTAAKALNGHNGGHFEDGSDSQFLEVKTLWDRATAAAEKADKAAELEKQDGHATEAATLMHEAAALYPEAPGLAIAAEIYDEGAAFERKDYDAFLALAQKQWKRFPRVETAAALSNALACKYAVTGNPDFRKQSEDMLRVAEQQSQNDPEAMKDFPEYAERTRYRLESREIISRQEYDRRFRSGQNRKN